MNKVLFRALLAVVGAVLILSSCSSGEEQEPVNHRDKAVIFSALRFGEPELRVTGNEWNAKDAIGVYMIPESMDLTSTLYKNYKYIGAYKGLKTVFQAAAPEGCLKIPEDASSVKFVAYYPYHQEAVTSLTVDVVDQNFKDIDLLYSKNLSGVTDLTPAEDLVLKFEHVLSLLNIRFVSEQGQNIVVSGLMLKGLKTEATLNLADGTVTSSGEVQNISAGKTGETVDFILAPQSVMAGEFQIVFMYNGKKYTWKNDKTISFESRKKQSFKITVKE